MYTSGDEDWLDVTAFGDSIKTYVYVGPTQTPGRREMGEPIGGH